MILDIGQTHPSIANRWARRMLATRFAMWAARELEDDFVISLVDSIERANSLETLARNVHQTSSNQSLTMICEIAHMDEAGIEIARMASRTGHTHAGIYVRDGELSVFLCEDEDALQISKERGLE